MTQCVFLIDHLPSDLSKLNMYFVLLVLVALQVAPLNALATDEDDDILLMMPPIIAISSNSTASSKPDLCEGYTVNDLSNRPMTSLTKPAPGASYIDPVFGSKVTRITNSDSITSGVAKTLYSTIQAWNADESRMILYHRGAGHYLYNGKTYSQIEQLDIVPSDIEQVFWSTTEPNIFFYLNKAVGRTVPTANGDYRLRGKELIKYDVQTRLYEVVKDFNSQCPNDPITAGNDVQMPALSNDLFGYRCGTQGFVYQVSNDTITPLTVSSGSIAPQIFPSAQHVYHQGQILSAALSVERTLDLGNISEHSSLGQLQNGHDAYFAVAFAANNNNRCGDGVGSLVVHDANNGSCRVLVGPANGYPYSLSGTHMSALAYKNPGWVVVSSIGYGIEGDTLLEQELYLANTDPQNPKVCRIAHHRATGRRGSIGYFAEPHPVLSPTGTRVLFSSDWNNSGQVDTFVIELPSH